MTEGAKQTGIAALVIGVIVLRIIYEGWLDDLTGGWWRLLGRY